MATIKEKIKQALNPFDPVTFATGNFWEDPDNGAVNVNSIHQDEINQITTTLSAVTQDHRPRTILLAGDPGSGKSYLLKRLKQQFNQDAFFAYIGPWANSDRIWRYILRETVDSMLKVPEGELESQLLLWLKSLPAFKKNGWLLNERQQFISDLRASYPGGIHRSKEFFGVLYDLTNPERYHLAYQWLRGEDLDEEDLKTLGVRGSIDNEDDAQNILINFGRISSSTKPIVLCFDQLDNIPRLPDGSLDLQALFNVNSTLNTRFPNNLLIIISIVTNTWRRNLKKLQGADLARLSPKILLKNITLEQAESLWASILYPLHQQAEPKSTSPIYPLTRQDLEQEFPGGKTTPRQTLSLGNKLIQRYKTQVVNSELSRIDLISEDTEGVKISEPSTIDLTSEDIEGVKISEPSTTDSTTEKDTSSNSIPIEEKILASLKLKWQKEFQKTEQKITRIQDIDEPKLIGMLREALEALEVRGIKPKFLSSSKTFASYSLSYQLPSPQGRIAVVWGETTNGSRFYHLINACDKAIQGNHCQTLYLIRHTKINIKRDSTGYKLYTKLFNGSDHHHLKLEDISSIHYLYTYHNLVNGACSQELVLADTIPTLAELQDLIRKSGILQDCPLLKDLNIFSIQENKVPLNPVKEFVLNVLKQDQVIGLKVLIETTHRQFNRLKEIEIQQRIKELYQENQIKVVPVDGSPETQSVYLVP
ncbi:MULTISPECIES: AAA family ATPase [unclassified Moorena]|uniref:AAA family ATPase n=1 Tax=unclassified Moorena TaxID=2683338 RepID=UPI0013FEABC3|nr:MULTISPECIES: AAA family ATPase [unclassified Moorena]NEO13288.1 ATP-binding protein [Moorena sp. SIO3E8]NEQ02462.1 ATP-binding protein [Moorena sp. SIO3F7]